MTSVLAIEDPLVTQPSFHDPVLLAEAVEALRPGRAGVIVDGTLGAGGHAEALLDAAGAETRLIGIDRDPLALELSGRRLARFGARFVALRGHHEEMVHLLRAHEIFAVDAILLDLGVSSMQLDRPERGFSFRADGPLDMRMDPESGPSAADLLARLEESELRRILWQYGEERRGAAIAREIVRRRDVQPLTRTGQLAELVERVLGPGARRYKIHPATRTFQALRIAVNHEIEGLARLVTDAVSILRPGGRVAVIAYHSLEDRAVKRTMRDLAQRCVCPPRLPVCGCGRENLLRLIGSKAIRPTEREQHANPRSRSARLRVGERI